MYQQVKEWTSILRTNWSELKYTGMNFFSKLSILFLKISYFLPSPAFSLPQVFHYLLLSFLDTESQPHISSTASTSSVCSWSVSPVVVLLPPPLRHWRVHLCEWLRYLWDVALDAAIPSSLNEGWRNEGMRGTSWQVCLSAFCALRSKPSKLYWHQKPLNRHGGMP